MKISFALVIGTGVLALAGCGTTQRAPANDSVAAANSNDGSRNTQAADPLLDHLAGKWVLTGTIGATKTTHDVDAEWVLNNEYLRLHEVSRERNTNGAPAYEAIVFLSWDQRAGEYLCLWLDSTVGGGLTMDGLGRGKPSGDTIPFVFKPGGAVFHNTFIYTSNTGTWDWIMDNEADGKLQPFARLKLEKG